MFNKLYFIILPTLFIACIYSNQKIELKWKPNDEISHFDFIDFGKLSHLKIKVNPINDKRDNKESIGKCINCNAYYNDTSVHVTDRNTYYLTNDDISIWATDRFSFVLHEFGLNVTKDNPDIILDISLIKFYVDEESVYHGNVIFNISVSSNNQENIWSGMVSGKSSRWGRTFSAENYYECIGNSFLQAVYNFISNKSFLDEINKL